MSLLCLVGRHGAGKSTIGGLLSTLGYHHISVGLLARLARSGQYPADVPVPLIAAMRRAKAGAPLPDAIALRLLDYAASFEKCVLDGFPASLSHLRQLPSDTTIGLVWVPMRVRSARLTLRAEQTKRLWTPGGKSEREQSLPALLRQSRRQFKTVFIPNGGDVLSGVERVAQVILRLGSLHGVGQLG